jgi:polysaccharide chain length determinant protein (PEP-CTERM system associated)
MKNLGIFLAALRYRWRLALLIAILVASSLAIVVWFLPNQYSATTTILVDPQKVPDRYVTTTVSEDPNERLNNLTQEVLSRSRLSQIVDKLHLYPAMASKQGSDFVIAYLRQQIQIQVKKTSGAALSAFTITYRSEDQKKVAPVTNLLAQSFIDWNLEQRQNLVEGTTKFLNDELVQARQSLQEQEARVRDYRLQHLGQMPEQMDANLATLARLQADMQAKSDALNHLDQERLAVLQDPAAPSTGAATPYSSPRSQLTAQIAAARKHLEDVHAIYTSKHPDVLAAQDHLNELEAKLAQLPSSSTSSAAPISGGSPETAARLQLLNEQKAQLLQQQTSIEAQIHHYQQLVDAVPVREADVSGLMRDYDSAKLNYQSLLEKSYSAEMATELERKQQGERFQVLDSAITPERPDSPNRILFWIASLFAGIAAGIAFVLLLEQVDTTIKTEAELLAIMPKGTSLLGHIPEIRSDAPISSIEAWSNQ